MQVIKSLELKNYYFRKEIFVTIILKEKDLLENKGETPKDWDNIKGDYKKYAKEFYYTMDSYIELYKILKTDKTNKISKIF